jgi:predicted nicotinamide N-methyase
VTPEQLVRAATRLRPVPFVPELVLHSADDPIDVWQDGETRTGQTGPPPFWAFPWAGGQGLARFLLDHPERVRGRTVLDLASGSGLVGIAAARAGAAAVLCCDVEPLGAAAAGLNAAANGVRLETRTADLLDGGHGEAEVVLAADVFYERAMAARMAAFLARAAAAGAQVLVGDPGRAYRPATGFEELAGYDVPVVRALEDRDVKRVTVLRAMPPAA